MIKDYYEKKDLKKKKEKKDYYEEYFANKFDHR